LEERRVAVIPRVIVQGAMGPKEYGLLLTSERSIFVLEKSSKAGIGAVLGGAIGAAIADAMSDKKSKDYSSCDPSALARDEKNICVSHASVIHLELKKKLSGYALRLNYTDAGGKQRKLAGLLAIPDSLSAKKKSEGVKSKRAMEEYAKMSRQALELALPPIVVQNAEWKI